MHLSPEDEQAIRGEFNALVNLEPAELKAWRRRPESKKVGMVRRGETESVGRWSLMNWGHDPLRGRRGG